MLKQLLATAFFLGFTIAAFAQQPDTTVNATADTMIIRKAAPKKDTVVRSPFAPKVKKDAEYHPDSTHIPSRAVKRSLIIPGWGQVYNHKYWKVPIIYGGLGLVGVAIVYNNTEYNKFLALARIKSRLTVPQVPTDKYYAEYQKYKQEYEDFRQYTSQQLADASDGFRRNRDVSILGVLLAWGVQAVDAYIDAKFISSYTMDDNLSMRVTPGLISPPMYAANFNTAYIPGIKFTFTLK